MSVNYENLGLSVREKGIFRIGVLAFGIAAGWLFYDKAAMGLAIGAALFPFEGEYGKNLAEKRKNALLMQFKDLLYSLSSSLSTGRSIGQGLEEAIDFCLGAYGEEDYIICELRAMVKKMKEGNVPEMEVLEDFSQRANLEDIRDFVMVCQTCRRLGGDLPQALDKSSEIIGDKITLEKELRTIMAQKRFESRIVALAPFLLILAVKVLSPAYLEPLTATFSGKVISSIALAMIAAAWVCIERVNRIEI